LESNLTEQCEWLAKAEQCLRGAESEFANQRYDNAANRAYYACFHAAIAALTDLGMLTLAGGKVPSHAFVQATFARELIHRRKIVPSELASTLLDLLFLRQQADYNSVPLNDVRVKRALDKAKMFVGVVRRRIGGRNGIERSATSHR
jgi:uncharacterized protein (UPF0332 family)